MVRVQAGVKHAADAAIVPVTTQVSAVQSYRWHLEAGNFCGALPKSGACRYISRFMADCNSLRHAQRCRGSWC